jgi:hypothetical protein
VLHCRMDWVRASIVTCISLLVLALAIQHSRQIAYARQRVWMITPSTVSLSASVCFFIAFATRILLRSKISTLCSLKYKLL